MTAPTVDSLQSEYDPLSRLEAEVVVRRLEDNPDASVEDVVAQVKAERVGPAADWEDVAAAEAEEREEVRVLRALLDDVTQHRIAVAQDSDLALREASEVKADLDHVAAYLAAADEAYEAETAPAGTQTNTELADASASDRVRYVKEHPEEADRVAEAENAREGGPRKTVLDACAKEAE